MNRARIAQIVGWLGLIWVLFVAAFFIFGSDSSTLLNNILHIVGLR